MKARIACRCTDSRHSLYTSVIMLKKRINGKRRSGMILNAFVRGHYSTPKADSQEGRGPVRNRKQEKSG